MTAEQAPVPATTKAPVKAMWICMILSWGLFLTPIPGTIFLAGPLNLAAFILAIVCVVRSRVGQGVIGLIGTTVISIIIYFIGLSLMAVGGAALAEAGRQAQQQQAAAAVSSAAEVITVSASKLVRDYKNNEVAADNQYKNKVLEITGKVASIAKDIGNEPYVTLSSEEDFDFRSVQCYFAREHQQRLANLSNGTQITIRGKCGGMFGNIRIDGAVFID